MAQAFITTYKNHYRWNIIEKRNLKRPYDPCAEKPPEGEMWLTKDDYGLPDDNAETSLAEAERMVKELYKERMRTIYQLHYCGQGAKKKSHDGQVANELLEYCKELYDKKTKKKVLPPLPGSRRVNGYLRPSRMYVPLTVYQMDYGKVAYDVLREHAESSESRENIGEEGTENVVTTGAHEPESKNVLVSEESIKKKTDKAKKKLECGCCNCRCGEHYKKKKIN